METPGIRRPGVLYFPGNKREGDKKQAAGGLPVFNMYQNLQTYNL
jgi:hypothetical protein